VPPNEKYLSMSSLEIFIYLFTTNTDNLTTTNTDNLTTTNTDN
jgi:hypothetical protein